VETAGGKSRGHGNVVGENCQTEIRFLFIKEGAAKSRKDMLNQNFYYACIYDILNNRRYPREKTPTLNHLKTKDCPTTQKRLQSVTIDTHEATLFHGESPTLFHLLQMRKRCVVTNIINKDGVIQKTTRGILHTFVVFLQANMNLFRWMMDVILEWRNLGIRLYRRDGRTS
jgi:hypothetical protein